MTVLEIMIVLAIIGAGMVLVRSGFRRFTKADLVEDSTELAAMLRRTSQLAIEKGELHRVVIDLQNQSYRVEVCQGQTAIERNKQKRDDKDTKALIERGQIKLSQLPSDAFAAGDPDEAAKKAIAVAGQHVADQTCTPVGDGISGITTGKDKILPPSQRRPETEWIHELRKERDIKFKQMWVQHRDAVITKDDEAIYFFPMGSAEKAVIELTDGSETFTVLVHGLTGRVELRDGVLRNVDDHMMRNAMGDRDAARETDK